MLKPGNSVLLFRIATVFFFSSRRRHTRYWRDWSSDVCSSDLRSRPDRDRRRPGGARWRRWRSEERRVGKECRSGWSPMQKKKKREANWKSLAERGRTASRLLEGPLTTSSSREQK